MDQAVNMHYHDIMGKKVCSCSFILPLETNGGLGDWSGRIGLRRNAVVDWPIALLPSTCVLMARNN